MTKLNYTALYESKGRTCKSAFRDEQAELGFAGLAIQTGVKSAIASLWCVSDAD
ncbi:MULTISPECIES: CHAT domain-containing protein [unclassified Nostoc]|uniref:CHAT domain-containing protein n=1 Tax=unclassified Nostoc TaxID=2593658 RepID=UPI001C406B76|nr:CHAT domain-containing protein [Nostoc sp. KVJ20]